MKIKFEFKTKTHLLSPETGSLEEIIEGISSRYPGHFKWGMIVGYIKDNALY